MWIQGIANANENTEMACCALAYAQRIVEADGLTTQNDIVKQPVDYFEKFVADSSHAGLMHADIQEKLSTHSRSNKETDLKLYRDRDDAAMDHKLDVFIEVEFSRIAVQLSQETSGEVLKREVLRELGRPELSSPADCDLIYGGKPLQSSDTLAVLKVESDDVLTLSGSQRTGHEDRHMEERANRPVKDLFNFNEQLQQVMG